MIAKKKVFGIFIISLLLFTFFMGIVLAQIGDDARYVAEAGTEGFIGIIRGIADGISPYFYGDIELLSRIFLAILLALIIYSIIDGMSKTKWVTWAITGAITALALIGIPGAFLEAIRIQYGIMGATILTIIPFLIVLVFSLRTRSLLMARVTWIVYTTYYFFMFIYAWAIIGKFWDSEVIPYAGGLIAGVIILFGIPWFRNLIIHGKIQSIKETGVGHIEEGKLLKELKKKELEEVYGS